MNNAIQLEVVTPDRRVLEAEVDEVILPGEEGYLGVRPGHTPLLTALAIGEFCYVQGGARHYAAVRGGFAEVLPDRVSVLTEAAEMSGEIDVSRAEESRTRAEKILQEVHDTREEKFQKAAARRRRAMIRISIARK
jgi:F-type H+-transporting ATPase subunit epsilon